MSDEKTGRKVIAKTNFGVEETLAEARCLAGFRHPNILTIFDLAVPEGASILFQVSELVEGVDLSRWMEEEHDPHEILDVVGQVLTGLQQVFERGLVHRDVKPPNIMVDVDGGVKIVDFSTCVNLGGEGRVGCDAIGTPGYAAPEQYAQRCCPATDVYAAGATVFDLLQRTDIRTAVGVREEWMSGESERLPLSPQLDALFNGQPELREGLAGVLRKALSNNPEDRHQSPNELWQAFERIFRQIL